MAYTVVMASKAEIMAFNADVTAASVGLTSAQFDVVFDVIHASVEAQVMNYINRQSLTAAILAGAGYAIMAAQLKLATIMLASNFFIWWKAERQGRVIQVNEGMAFLSETKVFTPQIQAMLDPFRIPACGAVSPIEEDGTESLEYIDPTIDTDDSTIEYRWEDGAWESS
jgi:hypothetical protein